MGDKYILDAEGNPVHEPDLMKWAKWFEGGDKRRLARTEISKEITVSTLFLGIDHNWGDGSPVLWETMIFGGPHDQYQERYTSRQAALKGHEWAVKLASEPTPAEAQEKGVVDPHDGTKPVPPHQLPEAGWLNG
jgi:hypothetical protein